MGVGKYGAYGEPTQKIEELEGLKLKEAFKHVGGNIKIGTGGGAWLYCGSTKVLKGNLHFVNGMVQKSSQQKLDAAVARLKTLINSDRSSVSGYLKKCANSVELPEEINPSLDGYMKHVEDYMGKVNKAAKAIIPHREMCEGFVPLGDRVIVEAFPSIEEPDITNILLTGTEAGWFWDIDECENAWEVVDGKLKARKKVISDEKE